MADTESDNRLRYDKMVEKALRGVVKQAVGEVRDNGLHGDHHFYITFQTDHEGVDIPEYLHERYPKEMTIVLQYQFYDLTIDDHFLGVTLSFNNIPERLTVPMAAITIFADPSVNFALQFQPLKRDEDSKQSSVNDSSDDTGSEEGDEKAESEDAKGEVISLDQFRKKDDD